MHTPNTERENLYESLDKRKVQGEVLKEAMRLGEMMMMEQLKIGLASNQRAASLCGIFTTATAASVAAFGTILTNDSPDTGLLILLGILAFAMFSAAIFCLRALLPVDFHIAGNCPREWLSKEAIEEDINETRYYEAWNYQENIEHNEKANERSCKLVRTGAYIGCGAPVLSMIVAVVWYLFS